MPNLKEVRNRITSVSSTQQITKAMKMVAAAKLRKAQDAIITMRPYADKLTELLQNLSATLDADSGSKFADQREVKNVLIVAITSNRGLCGAFNTNIVKAARKLMNGKYKVQYESGKGDLLFIGKKGLDQLKKEISSDNIITEHLSLFSDLSFDAIVHVPNTIIEAYIAGEYDAIEICYGRFKNAAQQFAEAVPFLPVKKAAKIGEDKKTKADYIFEPDKEGLLKELIPSILRTHLHRCMLDTHASEHGARMTAMDSATENANDLLRDLRISYNKARQEAITSEISEIVGGAAALEGA